MEILNICVLHTIYALANVELIQSASEIPIIESVPQLFLKVAKETLYISLLFIKIFVVARCLVFVIYY